MKIIDQKRSLKLIGLQVALIISILLTQTTMLFFQNYRVIAFEKKDGSWITIAETAEGNLYNCQQDLEQAQKDKHDAILSANPDLK